MPRARSCSVSAWEVNAMLCSPRAAATMRFGQLGAAGVVGVTQQLGGLRRERG